MATLVVIAFNNGCVHVSHVIQIRLSLLHFFNHKCQTEVLLILAKKPERGTRAKLSGDDKWQVFHTLHFKWVQ